MFRQFCAKAWLVGFLYATSLDELTTNVACTRQSKMQCYKSYFKCLCQCFLRTVVGNMLPRPVTVRNSKKPYLCAEFALVEIYIEKAVHICFYVNSFFVTCSKKIMTKKLWARNHYLKARKVLSIAHSIILSLNFGHFCICIAHYCTTMLLQLLDAPKKIY